jgi:glyoxylase-like metal-dependent hydrolase (beta-lactamase superfamily II)
MNNKQNCSLLIVHYSLLIVHLIILIMLHIKVFVFNPVLENTYLLYDETKEATLIDCGAMTGEEKSQLSNFIKENGLSLKHVLNTHLHFDHILGNHFIFENYGLQPEYHQADEPMLQKGTSFSPIKFEPVFAGQYLEEEDEITFGNTTLTALATPGHSPGSLSFYSEKEGCVFTGDALFHLSIGRTDLWHGNHKQLIDSIRKNLLTLPEETVVYPGHEEPSTIGEEKLYNPHLS